ncbi:MAG: multicopper oxidase family protein, partial [Acidiferrobacteraceae bacterium]
MDRRGFLKGVTGGTMGVMTAAVVPRLSSAAMDRDALSIRLTATRHVFSPVPGIRFHGLAYNGRVPGPVIRVRYGQELRALLVNHTGRPSTIHWHGMILPNDMDGVPGVTQKAVPDGGSFLYAFKAQPPGTRWYHSHVGPQQALGLFGALIVEDPREAPADVDVMLVFHDVPNLATYRQALAGRSKVPMIEPKGAPELRMDMSGMMPMRMPGMNMGSMSQMMMGDEVGYVAHCINGESYPRSSPIKVRVGDRVRLRILNASPTDTRYVRLAGYRLRVTHSDGNPLAHPVTTEVLRIGVAERYDVEVEITRPGAWLLQGLTGDRIGAEQAVRIYTEGNERRVPERPPASLEGAEYFTYTAGGVLASSSTPGGPVQVDRLLTLSGGMGGPYWRINGKTWPRTPRIRVHAGDHVMVRFR